MAVTNPNIDTTLGAAAQTLLTSSTAQAVLVLKATATNSDNQIHSVSVWRVPTPGAPSNNNRIINAQPIPPGGGAITLNLTGQTLYNGQSFYAAADVPGVVNLNLSYQLTQ